MNNAYDAIIIGAGMVGSAIACGLARADMRVAVVEPSLPPACVEGEVPHIRVSALSLASENILKNVGAWDYLKGRRTCPYRHLAVNELPAKTGFAASLPDISTWAHTRFSAADIGQDHLGHIIENDLIQLALHEAMQAYQSISLFCPDSVARADLGAADKIVVLESDKVLKAPLVIGADGAKSVLREMAGIGQFREQYEQHAFVATARYRGEQQDMTWQSFTTHGPLAFLPLADSGGDHYASLVWYDMPEAIDKLMALPLTELRQTMQRHYPETLPQLVSIEQRARFPLFKSHALQYVKQGIALAGDAAHTINPLAGQGVNLGFMDAAVLVETIVQARLNNEDIGALDTLVKYEQKRRLANQSMMSMMDLFYHGFGNKHLPVRVARNLGLGLANRLGFAKNKVMAYATGLAGDLPKLAKPI